MTPNTKSVNDHRPMEAKETITRKTTAVTSRRCARARECDAHASAVRVFIECARAMDDACGERRALGVNVRIRLRVALERRASGTRVLARARTRAASRLSMNALFYGITQGGRSARRSTRSRAPAPVKGNANANANANGGKSVKEDVTHVTYREGESLAAHLKLGEGVLDVKIPAGATTSANAHLRTRQLWGTDTYTADSDLMAVLTHAGYYRPSATAPPTLLEVHVIVRAAAHPEDGYPSTSRNGIRSRAWGTMHDGVGFVIESARAVTSNDASIDLTPSAGTHKVVAPTFFPVEKEHVVHTRNSVANSDRKKGMIREVTIQYNLCNEPWMKYSISLVADQGFKKSLWTCARLRRDVLYLETQRKRFELSCVRGKENEEDKFRWCVSKKPLPLDKMREVGVPLPKAHVDVVDDDLRWDEINWGLNSLFVRGKEYHVSRIQFLPREEE
jgi:hypothetical protein